MRSGGRGPKRAEHVLRKIHHCTFWPKISQRPFLGFQPKIIYSNLHIGFTSLYPLYTHLHPIFPFLHLTFYSRNNKYYIHHFFFLTSSLHRQPFITTHFVHHCTLKQVLA